MIIYKNNLAYSIGCDRRAKHSREEPPHVRGQGQKPGGPHARRAEAKRSYPMSKVRGSGQEYQTVMAQEQPRGATPHPRLGGGGAAERRYPASKVRGSDESSYPASEVRGGGRKQIPHALKPEAKGGGWEELPHARGWGVDQEDQPHVQGAVAVRA